MYCFKNYSFSLYMDFSRGILLKFTKIHFPGSHHWDQNLALLHRKGSLRCLWWQSQCKGPSSVNSTLVSVFLSIPETWKKTRAAWSCKGSQIHSPILSQSLLLLPSEVSMFSFRVKASAGKLLSAQSNGTISVFISECINLRLPFLTALGISV